MSDQITPQLREEVLERLRGMAASRNYTKSPEEVEQLILERARGVKKVYLDLISRVLDPALSNAGSTHTSQPQMVNVQFGAVQRPQQPLPASCPAGPQAVVSHRPRLTTILSQPNVHPSSGSQGVPSSSQPVSVNALSSRVLLMQSGGPRSSLRRIVALPATISTSRSMTPQGPQPIMLYQQSGSTYTTANDNRPTTNQPSVSRPQAISISNAQIVHQGSNYGMATGSNPIMIRTTSSGSIAMPGGQHAPMTCLEDPTSATKPVFTVVPGTSPKTARSNLQSAQKLGTGQLQQMRGTTQVALVSNPASGAASAAKITTTGRPNNSSSSNRTSASSSSSKSAHEAQTPEVQAQIVSRLTDIANRYLPAVHHAIQLVSMQPESHVYVRKYTKLKDILENPEANLHVIRLSQVNLIEQLLLEIEKNPMHLVQQQQQQQQQQPQAQAKAVAAAAQSAAAAASASPLSQSTVQPSDVRRHPGVDQSRHHLSQQPPSQLLSRFRVPTTNLNTLLSQPLGGSSPTSTPDTQQTIGRSPHGKPILHHTSSMPHTSLLSTSPDVSLPNTASVPSSAGVMGSSSFPLDSQSTTRQGQFSYTSLEGQHNRSSGAATSYTSPCATPGRTFGSASANSNLQIFATEFKKISDKATHDKEYARQLYRAINEISQELKPFRETAGLLLPQDLYAAEMHSIQHKGPGEGPCLSKFAGSRDPIESSVIPTAEDITDLMETSTCEVKTQHQTNETVSQLDGGEIHFKPCTNMIKVDDVEMVSEKDQNGLQSDMIAEPAPPVKRRHKCTSLFIDSFVSYDPEATPMTTFSPDQLERLNPVVQHEIEHLHQLHICVQSNTNPPCIDDMETYSTCMDAGEWNASCHLKLTLEKENAECLPCYLPPLMVRLAPDYVTSGHLNWYYSPKSAFQATAVTLRSGSAFTARECREFLDLCYSELDRSLQQHLRRITHYRLNLRLVAKSWLDAICTAMSQFVKLDLNALLAA